MSLLRIFQGGSFNITFDDLDPVFIDRTLIGTSYSTTFGPGCPDGGGNVTRKLSEEMESSTVSNIDDDGTKISVQVEILNEATIQITISVPHDQDVTVEIFDAIDPTFHELVHDGRHVTVDDPLFIIYDLGDLYMSTYEARITGEDGDVVPLILHRPLDPEIMMA